MEDVNHLHMSVLESHYGALHKWLPDHGHRNPQHHDTYRDSQRQKLYDSETATVWGAWGRRRGNGRKFQDLDEIQTYLQQLLDSDWWTDRFPHVQTITVESAGCESAWAKCYHNVIGIPDDSDWAMTEPTVLHELAHIVVKYPHPGHGALFARVYLDLVRFKMTQRWATELEAQFKKHKVRYTPYPAKPASQTAPIYGAKKGHRVKVSSKLYEQLRQCVLDESPISGGPGKKGWDARQLTALHVLKPVNQNKAYTTVELENTEQISHFTEFVRCTRWDYIGSYMVAVYASCSRLLDTLSHYSLKISKKKGCEGK